MVHLFPGRHLRKHLLFNSISLCHTLCKYVPCLHHCFSYLFILSEPDTPPEGQQSGPPASPVALHDTLLNCLFVCGISLTCGQLVSELFPDCTRSCFSQVVLRPRGGDCIYVCLFVCGGSLTSGQLVKGSFQTA